MLSNPEQPKIIVRDLDAKWHFIIEIHLQMTPNPGLTQKFNFFCRFCFEFRLWLCPEVWPARQILYMLVRMSDGP